MPYIPNGASGHETWATLVEATPFSHYVIDRPIKQFLDFPNLTDTTPAVLKSHGTGTASLSEVNSSEIAGLNLANTNSHGFLWRLPAEIDLSKAIDFRFVWGSSGTSGSAQFTMIYTPLALETTAVAIGATALGTVIADDTTIATAHAFQASPWGTIAASTLAVATYVPGDAALACKVTSALTTISDASVYYGDVRYYRKYIG